jgi:hypothetical protein
MLSQPDVPLWVRGLAAVLALVASWWLVHTDAIRGLLGNSVAALSLGIVAVFVIRGTHQPLGLWPGRPLRSGFSMVWAMAAAGSAAGLIALAGSNAAVTETVRRLLSENLGIVLLVMVGAVGWALGLGLVRQRRYARWYGLAVISGLTPVVVSRLLGWSALPSGSVAVPSPGLYAFLFWVVADTSRMLVTEELAFRRMLIGRPDRAGMIVVLGAAVVSAIWLPLVGPDASPIAWQLVHGLAVASVAGGLYVLSGSLLVAALYHGVYLALLTSFVVPAGATPALAIQAPVGTVLVTMAVAVLLVGFGARERGWIGQLVERRARDAAGD